MHLSRPPKSDLDFLKDHLDLLLSAGETARKTDPAEYNTFGLWTTLKLICVAYWQWVYSTIIPEHLRGLRLKSMAYLDVMASSGLNLVDGKYWVCGSTVLACTVPKKPYDYNVAIENQKQRASALQSRIGSIRAANTFNVVPSDADAVITGVLDDLASRKAHFLAFVDYEGLKGFSWQSMEFLLRAPCDILFTFFPNIKRAWAVDREMCRPLFGDLVDTTADYDQCLDEWFDRLTAFREFAYGFSIDSGEGYHYHLVLLTRRTRGGSPYRRAAESLESRLSRIQADFADKALKILAGGQKQIDDRWS